MKKGISIWSFPDRSPEVCFAMTQKHGYDGVEVGLGPAGPLRYDSTDEELAAYRAAAAAYGLSFYSVVCDDCWQYPLTADDPAVRQKGEEMVIRQLEIASKLGCDTILVLPGMVQGLAPDSPVVPYDVCYDRALAACKRLAVYAEKYGVVIGLENVWNKFLLSPLEMRDFIDEIDSPWVKAYFDVGNIIATGYAEQWISILGDRIAKVHFKDYIRADGTPDGFTDILQGDVNYPAVMAALRAIGYDDWVTAEVFAADGDTDGLLARNSAAVDAVFKM